MGVRRIASHHRLRRYGRTYSYKNVAINGTKIQGVQAKSPGNFHFFAAGSA